MGLLEPGANANGPFSETDTWEEQEGDVVACPGWSFRKEVLSFGLN